MNQIYRPRRLRRSENIRGLVRETCLRAEEFIYPMFVMEGQGVRDPLDSMPGQHRFSVDELVRECEGLAPLGIGAVNLFGYCEDKDDQATQAYNPEGLIQRAVSALKTALPELCVQTDVALDPYTEHGHDGLVIAGEVVNDESVEVLCKMAVSHAAAGVDWVAPSDMMDGRVGAIRRELDRAGYSQVGILAYSAKYASCFYGPFRGALKSAPKKGDKKTYQMDPANVREAIREAYLDEQEGADMLMVKPALAYLDVVRAVREETRLPLATYNVSGEYSAVKAAAARGWLDEAAVVRENLVAMTRAGADLIITYHSREALEHGWL